MAKTSTKDDTAEKLNCTERRRCRSVNEEASVGLSALTPRCVDMSWTSRSDPVYSTSTSVSAEWTNESKCDSQS
eukprot:2899072-Prymnesium_polylepis.1